MTLNWRAFSDASYGGITDISDARKYSKEHYPTDPFVYKDRYAIASANGGWRTIYGIQVDESVLVALFERCRNKSLSYRTWRRLYLESVPYTHVTDRIYISMPNAHQFFLEIDPESTNLSETVATTSQSGWTTVLRTLRIDYILPDIHIVPVVLEPF